MADNGLQADLALALRGRTDSFARAIAVSERLAELQGQGRQAPLIGLVNAGPPEGGGATWGACLAAALQSQARDEHGAAFLAFERMGGYWHLLEQLSGVRGIEPSARQAYYSQFDDAALLAALVAALDTRGPADAQVRRCIRNLARGPGLRVPLQQALPVLVREISDDALSGESAAALCNLACHNETKEQAVASGAVRQLTRRLGRQADATTAEDLVACLGVLTGGCEAGMAALFEVAVEDGRQPVFGPLFALLKGGEGGSPPPLQSLVLDVVGGLCAGSPQFKAWAVQETPLVKEVVPQLLRSDVEALRKAALEFTSMLLEEEGFTEIFCRANGVAALQSVLERDAPEQTSGAGGMQFMSPGVMSRPMEGRRAPSQRQLAQFLLSKILII